MNTPRAFDRAGEREWQAQERAVLEERLGSDPAGSDARLAQYRLLVRALRHPPLDPIPADFAATVATRAAHRGLARVDDDRFEALMLRGLLAVLAVTTALIAASYGGHWLQAMLALLPRASAGASGSATGWMALLVVCVAASALFERWHRHRSAD